MPEEYARLITRKSYYVGRQHKLLPGPADIESNFFVRQKLYPRRSISHFAVEALVQIIDVSPDLDHSLWVVNFNFLDPDKLPVRQDNAEVTQQADILVDNGPNVQAYFYSIYRLSRG